MQFPLDTIIVEDDVRELRVLTRRLSSDFFNVTSAKSFNEADIILQNKIGSFDLAILDVQLGDKECYELLDKYGNEKIKILAFTTINKKIEHNYAPKNYPLMVLEKPHNRYNVDELIDRISNHISLISNKGNSPFQYYFRFGNNELLPLNNTDILAVEASDDYAKIHYKKSDEPKSALVYHGLNEIEQRLDKNIFWRSHKSFIVNKGYIHSIEKDNNKGGKIKLKFSLANQIRYSLERLGLK